MIVLLFDLPNGLLPTYRWNSKRLEKRPLPRASRVQNSVKPDLHDVLHNHPNDVISPDEADHSPRKWRHEPALAAHEHCGDLRRDDRKEELRVRIRWPPKGATRASHE